MLNVNVASDFVLDATLDNGIVNANTNIQRHFMYPWMQRYIKRNQEDKVDGYKDLYWGYIGPGKHRDFKQNIEVIEWDDYNYSVTIKYVDRDLVAMVCPSSIVIPE